MDINSILICLCKLTQQDIHTDTTFASVDFTIHKDKISMNVKSKENASLKDVTVNFYETTTDRMND